MINNIKNCKELNIQPCVNCTANSIFDVQYHYGQKYNCSLQYFVSTIQHSMVARNTINKHIIQNKHNQSLLKTLQTAVEIYYNEELEHFNTVLALI
jgi:hypothetical protein